MAALILPSRLTQQPAYRASVNWRNPLTRGIAFLQYGGRTYETVSATPIETLNATRAIQQTGAGFLCSDNAGVGQVNAQWNKSYISTSDGAGTGDFAICVLADPISEGTERALYSQKNDALGTPYTQIQLYANGSGFVAESGSLSIAGYAAGNFNAKSTSAIDGNWHMWWGIRRAGLFELWRDGVQLIASGGIGNGDSPVSSNIYASGQKTALGADANGSTPDLRSYNRLIPFAASFNRAPSAGEIREISNNPWQLLQAPRRRIWVAVGGAAFSQTVSASSSLSPVRIGLVGARRAGTVVTTAALLRAPRATRTASSATVGKVVKSTATAKAAASLVAGSTNRSARLIRAAITATAATIVRAYAAVRSVIAASPITAAIARAASKVTIAQQATAGTVAKQAQAGRAAAIAASATMSSMRVLLRSVIASLTAAATAVRTTGATRTASSGTSATARRDARATRAASSPIAGSIQTQGAFLRTMSAVATVAASTAKRANIIRSAAGAMIGSLAAAFISGSSTVFRTLSATVGSAAALVRSTRVGRSASSATNASVSLASGRTVAATSGLSASIGRGARRAVSAASAMAASIAASPVLVRVLSATVGMFAARSVSVGAQRSATVAIASIVTKRVSIVRAAASILQAFISFLGFGSGSPIVCAHWTFKTRAAAVTLSTRHATWTLIGC